MGRIMITCPSTGRPVWTGFEVGIDALEKNSFTDMSITGCPDCGQTHIWSNATATVAPDDDED